MVWVIDIKFKLKTKKKKGSIFVYEQKNNYCKEPKISDRILIAIIF